MLYFFADPDIQITVINHHYFRILYTLVTKSELKNRKAEYF